MSPKRLRVCLVLFFAATTLSACGGAYSTRPLYSAADEQGAPGLREGLWLRAAPGDAPCKVDTQKPVGEWPGCAAWTLVRDSATWTVTVGSDDQGKPAWTWSSTPYILAAGEPRIFQTRAWGDHYYFKAAFDLAADVHGLVRYSETPIRCTGSPPATSRDGGPPDRSQDDCYFPDRETLILRAKKSIADPASVVTYAWVRAFGPEDQASIKNKAVPVEPAPAEGSEPPASAAKP